MCTTAAWKCGLRYSSTCRISAQLVDDGLHTLSHRRVGLWNATWSRAEERLPLVDRDADLQDTASLGTDFVLHSVHARRHLASARRGAVGSDISQGKAGQ